MYGLFHLSETLHFVHSVFMGSVYLLKTVDKTKYIVMSRDRNAGQVTV
jgi:hypothetical protein